MSKLNIVWEDEDNDFDSASDLSEFEESQEEKQENDEQEFGEMLESDSSIDEDPISVGDKVVASISYIKESSEDVLLELGGKITGVIAKQDLPEHPSGEDYLVGDQVEVFVISHNDSEYVLSATLSPKMAGQQTLAIAFSKKIPIKGKVVKVNKGGFEVKVFSKNAFCPLSQMELSYVENPEEYIGRDLDFIIKEMNSKKILLSRKVFLQQKSKEAIVDLRVKLENKSTVKGKVVSIKPFGAMVDVNGAVGMLHISELSYARAEKVEDFVKIGEELSLKILSIEEGKVADAPARISLSLKQAQTDPWEDVSADFSVGDSCIAKVIRLTDFGAFVELKTGLDGLIHLSEMSWSRRVHKASEVLKLGDQVEVRILDINKEKRRISLSMKSLANDPWQQAKELNVGKHVSGKVEELKSFGAIVELAEGLSGMVPMKALKSTFGPSYRKKACPPSILNLKVLKVDEAERKILLTLQELKDDDHLDADYRTYLQNEEKTKQLASQKGSEDLGSFGELLQLSLRKK